MNVAFRSGGTAPSVLAAWLAVATVSAAGVNPPDSEAPRRIAGPSDPRPSETSASTVRPDFDPYEVQRIELTAVEQSIADRGPLDAGLRWMPSGLRLPTGYDQVYTREGGGFWRADGGLVAKFQQSVYVPTRSGLAVDIPASTVFVIGGVPLGSEPGHGRLLAVDPLDPTSIPPVAPSTMVPDEHHHLSAVPGDHLARFGFGPGYRIAWATDDLPTSIRPGRTRFQDDASYRGGRLAAMLAHWRHATRPSITKTPSSSVREDPRDSEGDHPRSSPSEAASPDPGP